MHRAREVPLAAPFWQPFVVVFGSRRRTQSEPSDQNDPKTDANNSRRVGCPKSQKLAERTLRSADGMSAFGPKRYFAAAQQTVAFGSIADIDRGYFGVAVA